MPPPWREHRYPRPGRRPPWWPEGEAWPPQDAEGWRELRRGFMRRAGCFFVAIFIFVVLFLAAIVGLVQAIVGPGYGIVAAVILIIVFALVVGRIAAEFRRAAEPMADLIEASGRVEAGELDVQVPERGRREVRALTRAFNAMSSRLSSTERERRRLLAEVSHELRTPLTVIQGNVEAMLDGVYPADHEHLERIRAETRQLERLIDDLRTVSLAETGQLPLQRETTDVDALAREVAEAFEADAQAAGVSVVVDVPIDLPELEIDGRRIRQVISNLVANALRHTPSGGSVTVSARATGSGISLRVADTGVGMSKEAVEHAFERFWRSGEWAGAGLGLAIVRDLVTAHGGTVSIDSEPDLGTRVTVDLPR